MDGGFAMTMEEIEQMDKRTSAVHEAGHATVLVAGGHFCHCWVWKNDHSDILEEKTWLGRVSAFSGFDATMAVAGIVATCMDEDPEVEACQIVEYWESEVIEPSLADMQWIPDDWEKRWDAVTAALATLRRDKALFAQIVDEIVEKDSWTAPLPFSRLQG